MTGPGVCPLYPQQVTWRPGANSRMNASTTRWYTLTPSTSLHGSVDPFGTVTGVYDVTGVSGDTGGTGSSACARSRASMATPAKAPAPETRTSRLESIALPSVMMMLSIGSYRRFWRVGDRGWLGRRKLPADRALELGAGDPVVAQRLDVGPAGVDLVALCQQELEDADEHRVVLELRLLDDLLAQGYQDSAVVRRHGACLLHPGPRASHLGADRDRKRGMLVLALLELGRLVRQSRLTLVKEGDRQLDGRADRPRAVVHLALPGDPEGPRREEPEESRQVPAEERLVDALAWGGEVEPLEHGEAFETGRRDLVARQVGQTRDDAPLRVRSPETHQRRQLLAILGDLG